MRTAEQSRKTRETDITVKLNLDGTGLHEIDTGIGFLNHMLTALAVHGAMDLSVKVVGDLEVDGHHTAEDTGIVLGQAFKCSIGDRVGIARYAHSFIPMDEALGFCAIDISDRAFLVFDVSFSSSMIGDLDTQLVEEFFRAFAVNAGVTLHLKCEYGNNDHHICEAVFKAFAHALREASIVRSDTILSTK